jgi:hypothetical protein
LLRISGPINLIVCVAGYADMGIGLAGQVLFLQAVVMNKLLSFLGVLGLTLGLVLGGYLSIAQADRDGGYPQASRQYDGRYPPSHRNYEGGYPSPNRERDGSHRYRDNRRQHHRVYDHCARYFPERGSRFDRCLKYELNPGHFHGW